MTSEARYEVIKCVLATETSPRLGPDARPGTLPSTAVNDQLDSLLDSTGITGEPAQLIRSLALLWHDHLDLSHDLSQSIDGADGSYLHGIMHRREPDFGNAAYWFRRVGNHPVYPELAKQFSKTKFELEFAAWRAVVGDKIPDELMRMVEKAGGVPNFDELFERIDSRIRSEFIEPVFASCLVNDGKWNPIAMIDACEAVDVGSADDWDAGFIREAQSIELHLLLKRFCAR